MDVEIGDTLLELADAGDIQDAIALCRSLSRRPKKGEDREKLRAVSRKLLERFAEEPGLHLAVATMLLRSGTLAESHECLRQMKRSFPEEDGVHERLGEVLLRMGDARGAVIAFERALTVNPDVAIEEVLTEARVLTRLQDARGEEAVSLEAKEILGDPSEPLAVRRRGLSNVKTPIVNDVRALVEGLSGAPPPRPSTPAHPRSMPPRVGMSGAPPRLSHAPSASGSIPPPPPDLPHLRARAEEPRTSRRGLLLGAGIGLAALVGGGVATRRYWGQGAGLDRALVALAVEAMLTAAPSQLDRATALLRRSLAQAPRSSEAAVRALQASILGVLDGQETMGGVHAGVDEAKARGASPNELAAGEALVLLLGGRAKEAKDRLEGAVPESQPIDAVVLHVVRGLVLERVSDATAGRAYEAAIAAEPRATAALIRLFRLRVAEGDERGASESLAALAKLGEDRRPLVADLEAVAHFTGLRLAGAAASAKAPTKLGDDLPRGLRAAGLAISAWSAADASQAAAMFGAAVLAAETASDASIVGQIALRRGALGAATYASTRANELGAGDVSGAFLAALVAHARGDLARVDELAKRLPERLAASCVVLSAYERVDPAGLGAAMPKAAAGIARVAVLAETRLRGARALEPAEIAGLAADGGPFGELVAVDAWLDRGGREDLDAASTLALQAWPREGRGALRAARVARLLRLRGDRAAAREALGEALAEPSGAALLEAILLRDKRDAATLRARAEAAPEALRPWLRALERVSAKEAGQARKILKAEPAPPAEAPFLVRLAAALALGAAREGGKGKPLTKPLAEIFPNNEDLQSAVKRFGSEGGGGEAPTTEQAPYE